jgi:ABC-type uncharacterized transport system substrate-binding protein
LYKIGILQLTQNLDTAVHGFKQALSQEEVEYLYFNVDGTVEKLPAFAQKLVDENVDLIFACTTPAAKAAIAASDHIPVVYTPVFDPISVGLAQSMECPGNHATGVSGMVSATDKVAFIEELLPEAKTLGMPFDPNDENAKIEVANFKKAAEGHFTLIELPIASETDISELSELLTDEMDAIFMPIGKLLEDNFASIVYYTDDLDLPIIASHAPNIVGGAIGGLAANHEALGYECGLKAIEILGGKDAGTIPVGSVKTPDVLLNQYTADNLDIELPSSLVERAKEIYN